MLIKDPQTEVYEDAVLNGELEPPPPYEEGDPDYDVYLWWPSSATPHLFVPEHLVDDNIDDVCPYYLALACSCLL
jgi:hypothetical protein